MNEDKSSPPSDFAKYINASGRMLLQARMVDASGPLTEQQREEIRRDVAAYIQQHGLTHKLVCKEIGGRIAANTLSEILSGKYRVSPEKLDEQLRVLNNWAEVNARRRAAGTDRPFVTTAVAEAILDHVALVAKKNYWGLVHGPSGCGKSRCVEALHDLYPGSIVIRIAKGCRTHSQLIQRVAVATNAVGHRRGPYLSAWDGVVRALRGSNRMLLIDEAHQIEHSGLEVLRDIWDECRIPITMFCTIDLLNRIRADSDPDHGQLRRRITCVLDLKDGIGEGGGGRQLFGVEDIRALYESSKVKLSPDAQGFLVDLANDFGFGSLGQCEVLVDNVVDMLRQADPGAARVTVTAALLHEMEFSLIPDRAMRSDVSGRSKRVRSRATG